MQYLQVQRTQLLIYIMFNIYMYLSIDTVQVNVSKSKLQYLSKSYPRQSLTDSVIDLFT